MAKILLIIGLMLTFLGLTMQFFPSLFSWFGKLPGDLKYEKEGLKIYFPISTMIILSLALSLAWRFFGK